MRKGRADPRMSCWIRHCQDLDSVGAEAWFPHFVFVHPDCKGEEGQGESFNLCLGSSEFTGMHQGPPKYYMCGMRDVGEDKRPPLSPMELTLQFLFFILCLSLSSLNPSYIVLF